MDNMSKLVAYVSFCVVLVGSLIFIDENTKQDERIKQQEIRNDGLMSRIENIERNQYLERLVENSINDLK